MQMKGLGLAMGIGAAVGAIAVTMLPKQSTTKKLVTKAADKVEDTIQRAANKVTREIGQL